MEQWQGFKGKTWKEEVDVRDFIINNFSEYTGDESFLAGPTETTTQLWDQVMDLTKQERHRVKIKLFMEDQNEVSR